MSRFTHLLALVLVCCSQLPAQEMRVYTTVSRIGEAGTSQPLGHSLTLFHSGKVYDFMEEVGEVVIYEPMNERFLFLDGNYRVAELTLVELNQFRKSSESESQKYLANLKLDGSDLAKKQAAALEFQLHPRFDERFDAHQQRLRMTSEQMVYEVKTASSPNPDAVVQYLAYADMAVRFNHILGPKALLPEPRMAVNSALRNRKRIPLVVDMRMRAEGNDHLQAEHKFSWELQAMDQRLITKWEQQINAKEAIKVSFRDYQRKLVTAK